MEEWLVENDGLRANVWTMMSADEALGYVYLPFSTPSDDHYGVHRPGDGLFGDSLVCLDAQTGKRVWHFQMAHHGLWDYDLPSRTQPGRHPSGRKAREGRRADEQAGLLLCLRPCDRQADLAHRRETRSSVNGPRRENVPDAALPDQARSVRSTGRHGERCH